jgi:nucleoside-diphosphate-sugar epimerase
MDIRDYNNLEKAMKGCDLVIHAAAALPLYSPEDIYTTDVKGSDNVLRAAQKNGIKRVIHISSTAVYGIPDHHPLTEEDKREGVGPYGEAKVLAEDACSKYRKDGMIVTILRPKSFIGKERLGVFAMLYEWAMDGKNFPILGSGNNLYQFLDVEDLCQATFLAMTKDEKIVNDTFNVGAKEFKTIKEDYQAVLDKAGFGKKIIPIPAGPAIFILRILEFFKISPLYKWIYETMAKDSFVSIEKAERILSYKPKYSNQDALLRNFDWYVKNVDSFKNSKGGVSHRVPWKQGALKLAKIFF